MSSSDHEETEPLVADTPRQRRKYVKNTMALLVERFLNPNIPEKDKLICDEFDLQTFEHNFSISDIKRLMRLNIHVKNPVTQNVGQLPAFVIFLMIPKLTEKNNGKYIYENILTTFATDAARHFKRSPDAFKKNISLEVLSFVIERTIASLKWYNWIQRRTFCSPQNPVIAFALEKLGHEQLENLLRVLVDKINNTRFKGKYEDMMEACLQRLMVLSGLTGPALDPVLAKQCLRIINNYKLRRNRQNFFQYADELPGKGSFCMLSYVRRSLPRLDDYPKLQELMPTDDTLPKQFKIYLAEKRGLLQWNSLFRLKILDGTLSPQDILLEIARVPSEFSKYKKFAEELAGHEYRADLNFSDGKRQSFFDVALTELGKEPSRSEMWELCKLKRDTYEKLMFKLLDIVAAIALALNRGVALTESQQNTLSGCCKAIEGLVSGKWRLVDVTQEMRDKVQGYENVVNPMLQQVFALLNNSGSVNNNNNNNVNAYNSPVAVPSAVAPAARLDMEPVTTFDPFALVGEEPAVTLQPSEPLPPEVIIEKFNQLGCHGTDLVPIHILEAAQRVQKTTETQGKVHYLNHDNYSAGMKGAVAAPSSAVSAVAPATLRDVERVTEFDPFVLVKKEDPADKLQKLRAILHGNAKGDMNKLIQEFGEEIKKLHDFDKMNLCLQSLNDDSVRTLAQHGFDFFLASAALQSQKWRENLRFLATEIKVDFRKPGPLGASLLAAAREGFVDNERSRTLETEYKISDEITECNKLIAQGKLEAVAEKLQTFSPTQKAQLCCRQDVIKDSKLTKWFVEQGLGHFLLRYHVFHLSTSRNFVEFLLAKYKLDINAEVPDGDRLELVAVVKGQVDAIRFLIAHGTACDLTLSVPGEESKSLTLIEFAKKMHGPSSAICKALIVPRLFNAIGVKPAPTIGTDRQGFMHLIYLPSEVYGARFKAFLETEESKVLWKDLIEAGDEYMLCRAYIFIGGRGFVNSVISGTHLPSIFWAVQCKQPGIVRRLLENDADTTQTVEGKSLIEFAKACGTAGIVRMLEAHAVMAERAVAVQAMAARDKQSRSRTPSPVPDGVVAAENDLAPTI